jgi:hypothetical protein
MNKENLKATKEEEKLVHGLNMSSFLLYMFITPGMKENLFLMYFSSTTNPKLLLSTP